jgi:hypothetical protein
LVESATFTASVNALGGAQEMDEILASVYEGATRNPLGYRVPPGMKKTRIARTRQVLTIDWDFIPAFRVWLRADVETHTVTLLYVELCPAEDMELG